jgi:hypothetical protein
MQMSFSERNEGGRGGALDRFLDTFAENLSESRIQLHCLIQGYGGAFAGPLDSIKRD